MAATQSLEASPLQCATRVYISRKLASGGKPGTEPRYSNWDVGILTARPSAFLPGGTRLIMVLIKDKTAAGD